MKLRCEVLSVTETFPDLRIKVKGSQIKGAKWRSMNAFEIEIPSHPATNKALYVGRIVTIEIKPK